MTRRTVGTLVVAAAVLGGASFVAARQARAQEENSPGRPTIARMYILNRADSEAVPVTLRGASELVPVAITGVPKVAFESDATVATRASRQRWEYRQVPVAAGVDATVALNAAGADGWEAVGTIGGPGATAIVMKRPK